MRYLSVCSGIEAATVAWHPLGWSAAAYSEIEAFPRAVLTHHYPNTPLHGDFTTIGADEYGPIDLLVGGTPCQSFSVAGLRGGLADDRGNLALQFLKLAQRTRARWLVWENVPGVLSSNGGRDFGSILGGMVELGYGLAYRVLDAQFFGVPQRRRRVFVVGHLGDWRRAAAVLFERHSLSGHPAPRREKGQGTAGNNLLGALDGEFNPTGDLSGPITTGAAHTNRSSVVAFAQNSRDEVRIFGGDGETVGALAAEPGMKQQSYVAIDPIRYGGSNQDTMHHESGVLNTLPSGNNNNAGHYTKTVAGSAVRRLTPRECERLQGFPDDYTLIPYRGKQAADGPRYKALGNSMAVPVMRWIGERIAKVEALCAEIKEAA